MTARTGGNKKKSAARRGSVRVDRREEGARLDLFLVAAFPQLSRKKAKRLVDGRRVSVNGRVAPMASRVLRAHDRVEVDFGETLAQTPPPEITVLYEDADCLAILKPPGLPSGPTRDPERAHAAQMAENGAGRPLTLLHRIDKETSGVLLLAKTREFSEALTKAFQHREVEKIYLALVGGNPQGAFDVVSHLREGDGGRMRTVRSGGLRAETRFRKLAAAEGYALLEARPRSGRTHQIRVQLAQAGHPILGDFLYGGNATVAGLTVPRQMLHARALVFHHPGLAEKVRVEAPTPKDFLEVAREIFGGRLPPPLAPPKKRRPPRA